MTVNPASKILNFALWAICVPIGCRHPFIKLWQPLQAEITATCSQPHPENEHQLCVNSCICGVWGNQGSVLIFEFITELLTAVVDKNTTYQRYNTDSTVIDFASCKASTNISLVVENTILIRYYSHTANATALIEYMD